MSKLLFLPIESLRYTQKKRRGISMRRVEELRQEVESGCDVVPIRVNALHDGTYVVKDGRHRIHAHLEAGINLIAAIIENLETTAKKWLHTFTNRARSMALFHLLPAPEAIISVLSDRNYMTNLWNKFCLLKQAVIEIAK